jgi:hypothetical protein
MDDGDYAEYIKCVRWMKTYPDDDDDISARARTKDD